ncbi:DMRL synthase family protein [Wallemia mellicola]|nr:DMRL synthase family protein [Wallemia mellicola]
MAPHSMPKAPSDLTGKDLKVGIVHTRWNKEVVNALVEGTNNRLLELGVKKENIIIQQIAGSWELPIATKKMIHAGRVQQGNTSSNLLKGLDPLNSPEAPSTPVSNNTGEFDAIISIGVLVKGSTQHFEYIAGAATDGLMRVSLDENLPVVFGVLTCNTEEQARSRAGLVEGGLENHGPSWAESAVELANLSTKWSKGEFA